MVFTYYNIIMVCHSRTFPGSSFTFASNLRPKMIRQKFIIYKIYNTNAPVLLKFLEIVLVTATSTIIKLLTSFSALVVKISRDPGPAWSYFFRPVAN